MPLIKARRAVNLEQLRDVSVDLRLHSSGADRLADGLKEQRSEPGCPARKMATYF
jgi:hypothetical protein